MRSEAMNADRLAKARLTRKANKVARARQTINVPPFKIVRIDDMNWQIQGPKLSKDGNYYGSIANALQALPVKILDQSSANSVAALLDSLNAIHGAVKEAVKQAQTVGALR